MMMDSVAWTTPGINGDAIDNESEMLWRNWLKTNSNGYDEEEEAEGSLETRQVMDREIMVNVAQCRGTEYDGSCGDCMKARGIRRQHKKGAMKHEWSVSADLSGPHPTAVGTDFRYLLVAVVTMGDGTSRLPFVKGMTSKTR